MRANNSYTEPRKIIKGDYERARDRWICALICTSHGLGRGATRVFQVAILIQLHTSRREFQQSGRLQAFPSLPRLAFMAGLSEKTVRRAIRELAEVGLLTLGHRFKNSNVYCLTIPSAAAEHSATCLNLLTNPRHRATRNGTETPLPSVPMDGQMGTKTLPSVQQHSEGHSDLHSIPKGHPSDAEEKRLGEKERICSSPLGHLYREAREFGKDGASVVARAMKDWGRDAEDIRDAIEAVREFDGDAHDLAHELWEPE
jgi:Replication protein C N-terminal domain